MLDDWLKEITETLAAYNAAHPTHRPPPFAINQIVHKSNDRLEHDMALCAKYKVPIIITSLGAREDINAGPQLRRCGAATSSTTSLRTRPSRRG